MKCVVICLAVIFTIIAIPILTDEAFARGPDTEGIRMTITLDQETYKTGETIKVSGNVGVKNSDSLATINLFKPDMTVVTSIQMMPDDDGIVSYHFKAGSGTMDVSGKYTFEITSDHNMTIDYDTQTEHGGQSVLKQFLFTNVIKEKTVGDDAPFFGIFVYVDNLFSWIMGK